MRRVVVTGMGIWSCIGQDLQSVTKSLKQGRSGIIFDPKRIEYGLHSGLVGNVPRPDLKPLLPRIYRDTMSEDAEYSYMAVKQALESAKINETFLQANEVGCIWGNDGNVEMVDTVDRLDEEHDSLMVGAYSAFRNVTSSALINIGTIFRLNGIRIGIGAACASSSHAIGIARMLIKNNMQDIIVVGGSCGIVHYGTAVVDAVGVVSLRNEQPQGACRPFDMNHDGMVPSGGAAALVLEDYEHAIARGATIFAEVIGYGFSNNGEGEISMANRDAEYTAMSRAIADADILTSDIDYVNAHATSTPQGDCEEAAALAKLFKIESGNQTRKPFISSTKSMTGHENWMAGASEAIYSILMMQNSFVAPNINLEHKIEEAQDLNIPSQMFDHTVNIVLSNSLGMGGTNSAIVLRKI